MDYILTGSEMKQADANTIEQFGVPSIVLMERAALALVDEMEKQDFPLGHVLAVCGPGNNGGDGLAAARILAERGHKVSAVLIGDPEKCSEQTKLQTAVLEKYGVSAGRSISPGEYTAIIDGIFGIGLKRPAEGIFREAIDWINRSGLPVVSADIPSGIHSDTGEVMGTAVRADLTVTFAFLKAGHVFFPGTEYAGEVVVRQIGITKRSLEASVPSYVSLEESDLSMLPERKPRSNKGSYGRALVIAGSKGMAGAAAMCAEACLRTGAGLVKLLTPEVNREILQCLVPEAMTVCLSGKDADKELTKEALDWADVICIGPGIGLSGASRDLVKAVLLSGKPAVVDADGLKILGDDSKLFDLAAPGRLIVTPHPGEMSCLTGMRIFDILKDLPGTAREFARKYKVTCVLKDARTVTAAPEGPVYINRSGNNGMATGGSGDVLTGIIGGLLAQGAVPETAAALGVFVHGRAGDEAASVHGFYSMTARDIIKRIEDIVR